MNKQRVSTINILQPRNDSDTNDRWIERIRILCEGFDERMPTH